MSKIYKRQLSIATNQDKAVIWNIFKDNKKVFPHIRNDYLQRQIKSHNVIFDKGVVLITQSYKKAVSLGVLKFDKGTNIIHQIVNSKQGNGNANKVLSNYIKTLPKNSNCILTVRKSNQTARKFYQKNGFKTVGRINWSKGTIEGLIYNLRKTA